MAKRHRNPAPDLTPGGVERARAAALQAARDLRLQACMAVLNAAVRGVLTKHGCGLTVRATVQTGMGGTLTVETHQFELLVVLNDPPAAAAGLGPGPGVAELAEFQRRMASNGGKPEA